MVLDIVFLAVMVFGMVYVSLQLIQSWWTRNRRRRDSELRGAPGITVFKPLKGVDDDLEDNLRTFFILEYPRYQLLFGLGDPEDPAAGIVRKLIGEYPHVRAKLIIDPSMIGLNPKINNLVNIYGYARYPYLLISDSNVRVGKTYLQDMMGALQEDGVGLVTSTIRGVGARSLGAAMENLHLNTFIAGSVFIAEHLADMPIAIGKSMLFARSTLERIGGFAAFKELLAEDYLIGLAIQELGLRVTTIVDPIENVNRNWSMARFCNRHTRWAKIRKAINPWAYFAEFLTNPIAVASVYALIRMDLAGLGLLGGIAAVKTLLDYSTATVLKGDLCWYKYLIVPLKDLLIGMIWYLPWFSTRVIWRGNEFRIMRQTRLQAVDGAPIREVG